MFSARTAYLTARTLVAAIVLVLAAAGTSHAAFTAPTPTSPDGGHAATEGGVITFKWTGSRQGDPTTLSRSFFRVEIAPKSEVEGIARHAAWPTITNWVITAAGANATSADMGVPDANTYLWRVCAWGVADATDASKNNALESLACSTARTLTSHAASSGSTPPGEVRVTETTEVQRPDTTIVQERVVEEPADPAPVKYVTVPSKAEPEPEAFFDLAGLQHRVRGHARRPATMLSNAGLEADPAASRSGFVSNALQMSLPGVGIPFWSLLLIVLSLPLALLWRRSTLRMFDDPDFADDGAFDLDYHIDPASGVKVQGVDADGAGNGSDSTQGPMAA